MFPLICSSTSLNLKVAQLSAGVLRKNRSFFSDPARALTAAFLKERVTPEGFRHAQPSDLAARRPAEATGFYFFLRSRTAPPPLPPIPSDSPSLVSSRSAKRCHSNAPPSLPPWLVVADDGWMWLFGFCFRDLFPCVWVFIPRKFFASATVTPLNPKFKRVSMEPWGPWDGFL